jgi:predicted O-linked N-acetylglucosamine transferase (SPINDLY family)
MCENYQDFFKEAEASRLRGEFDRAITLYEQAISAEPALATHYWYLGLVLLLQGKESEAQLTWMTPLLEAPEQQEVLTVQLLQVLQTEAARQETLLAYQPAWLVRQHIREIAPQDGNNRLHIIQDAIALELWENCEAELVEVSQAIESTKDFASIEIQLLVETLEAVLKYWDYLPAATEFIETCLTGIPGASCFVTRLFKKTIALQQLGQIEAAISFVKICLNFDSENFEYLWYMTTYLQESGQPIASIDYAEQCFQAGSDRAEKVAAMYLLLKGLMQSGGNWERACQVEADYRHFLCDLSQSQEPIKIKTLVKILTSGIYFSYFRDRPQETYQLRQQIGLFLQSRLREYFAKSIEAYSVKSSPAKQLQKSKVLKIGYLSDCFRLHSVGWLVRWLLKYHDPNSVELHVYSARRTEDWLQQKFAREYCANFHHISNSTPESADRIYRDGIDILVDLDSLTSMTGCSVMMLKPAPVQVSWLGFDAAGLSTIDYFIADPYVLPHSALNYYQETIWRLPHTYIAVDGFEIGVPTLRRDRLSIPSDAVVYFCSQTGYKRHPDNIRLQMKIIKDVPNGYLLIKGVNTHLDSMKSFFEKIAEEEGVNCDRLRFLPSVSTSQIHRANLGIADIVLDTYPYNGTTTTLETLWMGLPVVTRVGEQFASRQGYTLLMNAGVTEGIAWTDEEYVEWGIRLGRDSDLRQHIFNKLQLAKKISPLWNTKQFAREMETAYMQMWEQYIEMKEF